MKQFRYAIVCLPLVVLTVSCDSETRATAGVENPIAEDDTASQDRSYSIYLTSRHEVEFADSLVFFRLFGFDEKLPNAPVTVIQESLIELDLFPGKIELSWPENAESAIQPPVLREENARFYFSVYLDSNKDGLLCADDLRQDYSATDFFTIQTKPSETAEFYMTQLSESNHTCLDYLNTDI